nr:hypothetical protein [Plectolyngbya sp. WJT66-NPBG17]
DQSGSNSDARATSLLYFDCFRSVDFAVSSNLHLILDIQDNRLIHKPKEFFTSLPQVESVVYGEGKFILLGGKHYGHVILQLESNPNLDGCFMLWSVGEIPIPDKYLPLDFHDNPAFYNDYLITQHFLEDVYEGLREAMTEETESDYRVTSYVPFPYENTNIRIIGGLEHPVDSKPSSFRRAACLALAQAVSQL